MQDAHKGYFLDPSCAEAYSMLFESYSYLHFFRCRSEMFRIHCSMAARSVLVLIGTCGAKMLVYTMVLAWILPVDGRLEASILFPAMALYQQLRSAFFSRVSMAVQYTGEAMASVQRVQVLSTSRHHLQAFNANPSGAMLRWW